MKLSVRVGATVAIVLLAAVAGSYRAGAATQAGPRVVCGAWFRTLPLGWHQSGSPSALVIGGRVPKGTASWAMTPRSLSYPLPARLPRNAIVVGVVLSRPKGDPTGPKLRLPLRLRDFKVVPPGPLAGSKPTDFLRVRNKRQYDVTFTVAFGRAHPPARLRRLADRILNRVVLPRWVPFKGRSSCPAH
jgi:hypothetical protein